MKNLPKFDIDKSKLEAEIKRIRAFLDSLPDDERQALLDKATIRAKEHATGKASRSDRTGERKR